VASAADIFQESDEGVVCQVVDVVCQVPDEDVVSTEWDDMDVGEETECMKESAVAELRTEDSDTELKDGIENDSRAELLAGGIGGGKGRGCRLQIYGIKSTVQRVATFEHCQRPT
jgi:hypothetical protein